MEIHSQILYFIWLIGIDIAISIPRYFKTYKYHLALHSFLIVLIGISTIILELSMLIINKPILK